MIRRSIAFLTGLLLVAASAFADAPTSGPTSQPATNNPPFVVGVWKQPVSSFAKWKGRGVNTLVGTELEGGAVSLDQYLAAAKTAGLHVWLEAGLARPADLTNATVTSFINQPDEPDGVGNTTPQAYAAQYATIKPQTSKPLFANFDGWKMQWRPAADYITYCAGGDWIGVDFYPFNRGLGAAAIATIGDRIDDLKLYSSGKPVFAFIECSDQDMRVQAWASQPDASGTPPGPRMRAPTAAELLSEVKMATDHGAAGVIYFATIIGNNFEGFDGTPADVAGALTAVNQQLTAPPLPPPVPAADPLANTKITIGGKTYTLTPGN